MTELTRAWTKSNGRLKRALHKRRKDGFNARKGYDGDLLRNTLCKRAHGTDLIQGSILPFELEDIIDVV